MQSLKDYLQERKERELRRPTIREFLVEDVFWRIERWFDFAFGSLREVKYAWQRARRGYSDRDLWDLSSYLANILVPGLTALRDNNTGFPAGLTQKQWKKELDIMIRGFEAHRAICMGEYEGVNTIKRYLSIQNKGLEKFTKHYNSLWD